MTTISGGGLPKMQRIGKPWLMLLTPLQRWQELQGKQRHTMNPGMRNLLISMLYLTILIIAKEDLLTGTGAPINNNGSSRSNSQNNPPRHSSSKEPACYHCAGPHYIIKCAQYQKDKDKYKCTTQQVKQN